MATTWNTSNLGRDDTGLNSADSILWHLSCAVLAVTSVSIGARWDVSWHRSIGRNTF